MNKIFNDFFDEFLILQPDLGSYNQLQQYNSYYSNRSNYNYNYEKLFNKNLKKIRKYNNIYAKVFKFYLKKELNFRYYNYIPLEPYNNVILWYINLCKGDGYQKLITIDNFIDFINKTNEFCNYLNNCIDEMIYSYVKLPKMACKILIKQIDEIIKNKSYLYIPIKP